MFQSCNKFNGDHHETILKDVSGSPMGIHIFHPVLEPMSNSPCYGAPCSHICVLVNYFYLRYTVECRKPNVWNRESAKSQTNASLVIGRSDFRRSKQLKRSGASLGCFIAFKFIYTYIKGPMLAKKAFGFRIIRSDFGRLNQLLPNQSCLSKIRMRSDFGIPLYSGMPKSELVRFSEVWLWAQFQMVKYCIQAT